MRFKEILDKYNITQQILADRMGMNRVSVSRLLSEKNDLRISTIEKIANAIGCTVEDLFKSPLCEKKDTPTPYIVCPHCGKEIELELRPKEK